MLTIDGSFGEGGGQILRTSIGLAALLGEKIKIINIRANRKPPGLKSQHLNTIRAVAKISNGELVGDKLGSKEIVFIPGKIKDINLTIDIGTAGSISLLLQSIMIFAHKINLKLKIIGGTDVKWSPTFNYLKNTIVSLLNKFGFNYNVNLIKKGYYPKGGGIVEFISKKSNPRKINTFRGELKEIIIYSSASKDLENRRVAERQAKVIKEEYRDAKIFVNYYNTLSTGSDLSVVAYFEGTNIGVDGLGEKGKKSEEVGREVLNKFNLEINSNSTVDLNLADNLIPFIGLFGGCIKFREWTGHIKTNLWVCKQFGLDLEGEKNEIRG